VGPVHPRAIGDGLDGLNGDVPFGTGGLQGIEVVGVIAALHGQEVVGEQDGVEVEPLEAATMGGRDLAAVAGDADPADKALLSRLDGCFNDAARAQRLVPLNRVGEVVELPQVDVVHAESVQRAMQLLASSLGTALVGLGSEEEVVGIALEPRSDAGLGIAIAGRDVDMVDAVLEQGLERSVRVVLGHSRQRGGAEDDAGAGVAGPAKGERGDDHGVMVRMEGDGV